MMIREAEPADASALIELERLCPERGRATIRVDLRENHFSLASRYPSSKGYVALAEDGSTILGTIFSSVAPTQLNGRLLPAAYLFSLRVRPEHRRSGVASRLIGHACERALVEEGARVAWAAVIEGNHASLRTFEHSGFVCLRGLRAKITIGGFASPLGRSHPATRSGSLSDLHSLAQASNHFHVGHNFWRPKTPELLRAELEAVHHSVRDSEIMLAADGTPVAAVSGFEVARAARVRLLSLTAPSIVERLFSPFFQLLPLNALLIHHLFSPPDQPALVAALILALQRRYLPRSWAAIIVADPLDPVSRGLDRLWGVTGHVHLVVKSDETVDQSRPSFLA